LILIWLISTIYARILAHFHTDHFITFSRSR
jgi:hypothetical protein